MFLTVVRNLHKVVLAFVLSNKVIQAQILAVFVSMLQNVSVFVIKVGRRLFTNMHRLRCWMASLGSCVRAARE